MDGSAIQEMVRRAAGLRLAAPPVVARWFGAWRAAVEAPPDDVVVVEESEGAYRATRVTRSRNGAFATRTARRSIPTDLDDAERAARVRQALTALVLELGAKGRPAVAALSGPDVVVRRVALPRMSPSDLRSALELECRKQVNYAISGAEIRYEVLQAAAAREREIPILVAVAPRRRVEEWRGHLAAAGLRPWSLTLPAVGLRADLARRGALADEVSAYLEVGHETSQLVVLKGNDLRFSRDLAFGTATMASALRQIVVPGVGTVDRTPEEAEALLRQHGIPMGVDEARFSEGVPLAAVSIMLRPALERLVRELWNSFDYCNEQFLGEAVTRVVLLGPGGRTRNLREHLAGVLKMPVTAADAEEGEGSPERGSSGALAASAALASVRRGTLNFFSGSPSGTGPGWLAEAVPAPAVAAVAAVIVVSIAAPAEWNVSRTRDRVAGLRADLSRFAAQSEAVARFREEREEDARLRALSTRLTGSQVVWSAVLRDLSHRIGPDVRLTAIEVVESPAAAAPADPAAPAAPAGRSLRISGLLRAPRSAPEGVLASLLRSLGASPVFDQVRLEGCERVSTDLSSFVVTARLAEGQGS